MKLIDVNIEGYDTLLLDRDGTINVHIIGDYVRCWDEFEFIPGVIESLKRFAKHFKHIIIVTNQRGIGKGKYSTQTFIEIMDRMKHEIEINGGRIDAYYWSEGLTDEDPKRKPNRGMFDDILRDYPDVNPSTTLMIGDGQVDLDFARNCGIDFVGIDSLKKENNKYYWEIWK